MEEVETSNKTFGTTLKDLLEKHEIKQKDLSKDCGINTSSLNKILNSGRESNFNTVLKLVKKVDVQCGHEQEMMLIYIKSIQNPTNIKIALEYCDTHDMKDMLKILCDRAESKANHMNDLSEYCLTYRLSAEQKYSPPEENRSNDLFAKLSRLKSKRPEMKILQSIIKLFMLQKEMNYPAIIDSIPKIEDQLKQSNSNIHPSLKMRLNYLLQTIYLRNICDFKKVRELAHEALHNSIGKRFDAAAYINIGESYIKENPDKALEYIKKSITIYKDLGLDFLADWMIEKVEFLSIVSGISIKSIQEQDNIALKYILNGQKQKGLEVLKKFEETPMRLYIKGMATDDPDDFWKSLEGYMKRGDRLYGSFPIKELRRLGENESVIEMAYNNTFKEVI